MSGLTSRNVDAIFEDAGENLAREAIVTVDSPGDLHTEMRVEPPGVREIELEDEYDLLETLLVQSINEVATPRRVIVADTSEHERIEDDRCSTQKKWHGRIFR